MTKKEAETLLRDAGMVITVNAADNEYRVNYRGGKEETAYYTNDLDDAVTTGLLMAQSRKKGGSLQYMCSSHEPKEFALPSGGKLIIGPCEHDWVVLIAHFPEQDAHSLADALLEAARKKGH